MKPIIYLTPTTLPVPFFGRSTPIANLQLLSAMSRRKNLKTTTLSYFLRLLFNPFRPPHPNPTRELQRQLIYLMSLLVSVSLLLAYLLTLYIHLI